MFFQWRLPVAVILGYRFVLAVYCIVWLIYTASVAELILIGDAYVPWPAFLTNWTYFLLTFYLTLHFVACVVYVWHRGGSCFSRPSPEHHCGLFNEFHTEPSLWTSHDYEFVQGQPESDEEVHTRSTNYSTSILLKAVWILYSMASNFCLMVTLLFWVFLWPMMSDDTDSFGIMLNVQLHAVTSIIVIIEHVLSAVPVRLYHYIFSLILGLIYVIFSLIYYAVDGVVIYPKMLDWGKPTFPIIVVVLTAVVVGPLVHLFFFAIYKLKLLIYSKINREHL